MSFRKSFGNLSGSFHDIRSRQLQILTNADHKQTNERRSEMSQFANIEMSSTAPAPRTAPANYNFAIAATLLAVALSLIAAQLVFVGNHYDALNAAADTAAFGIIGP
jgi:hypothetical protein